MVLIKVSIGGFVWLENEFINVFLVLINSKGICENLVW